MMLGRDIVFEQIYSFKEGAFCSSDNHIDRVEISSAVKAPGQICFWIDSGMKISTQGTPEAEKVHFVPPFHV